MINHYQNTRRIHIYTGIFDYRGLFNPKPREYHCVRTIQHFLQALARKRILAPQIDSWLALTERSYIILLDSTAGSQDFLANEP